MKVMEWVRSTTVGRSIWRTPPGDTPRDRAVHHWANFLLHLYPVKVRRSELRFRTTWFLGVAAITLFVSLLVSGIYLMFFYVPSPSNAYVDIQNLQTSVGFGQFIRNVHRWSAHLMVLIVAVHMAKVFYRGAYKPPREFNWVIGVMLLIVTMLMSFTGYLLPWDQLAFWAVTVGTSIAAFVPFVGDTVSDILLGGSQVGADTLLRFYVFHVAVLPVTMVALITAHLWRWRKDRQMSDATEGEDVGREDVGGEDVGGEVLGEETVTGSVAPVPAAPAVSVTEAGTGGGDPLVDPRGRRVLGIVPGVPAAGTRMSPADDDEVLVNPHLLVRHGVAALGTLLLVLILAIGFDAPLRAIANPQQTPNPEKAPWYFAGLQELLSHLHPMVAGVLVPAGIVIGLMALPYVDRNPHRAARHRRVAVWTFSIFLVLWVVLTLVGFAFRGPGWRWVWPWNDWYGEL